MSKRTAKPAEFTAASNVYHAAHDAVVTAFLDGVSDAELRRLEAASEAAHDAFVEVAARYRMSAV